MFGDYVASGIKIRDFNRNIKLFLLTSFLFNIGFAAFQTDFNLYILSMGMSPNFLGIVLGLAPFAAGIASIPIGYLIEKIGFKKSFKLIYILLGVSYLLQVISSNQLLIMFGSFLVGLVACGNFIIQLPFVSHYSFENQNQIFSTISIINIASFAIGSLLGGYLPNLVNTIVLDLTLSYRILLIIFCLVVLLASIPVHFLDDDEVQDNHKISLSPYLHNMDANTAKFATIELFIGLGMAFLISFMNIIFVYHFKSSLEFFGTVSALLVIPTILLLFWGPILADKFSGLRVILICRFLITFLAVFVVMTQNPFIGAIGYILFRSIFNLAQTLWFGFAVSVATKRSRMATSTWLESTFQIGLGLAAIIGGRLINNHWYIALGVISSISMGISYLLTYFFFGKEHLRTVKISRV
jgi:predicted MFS family arabinose efflux permease